MPQLSIWDRIRPRMEAVQPTVTAVICKAAMKVIAPDRTRFPIRAGLVGALATLLATLAQPVAAAPDEPGTLLERYCFDCHDDFSKKGDLDLAAWLDRDGADGTLLFENLITGKMPPAKKEQPTPEERRVLLEWLARRQPTDAPPPFRRLSRHEFVHSINDLLGTNLDLAHRIPEDRGTRDFDSDRRIALSREMLGSYFTIADEMLEFALPTGGIPAEGIWVTDEVKDSHETYNIYHRPHEDGLLFSWTRANNGNNYSFFYDHFEPPVAGWYDLTFEAGKVGDLEGDISLQVYAGKYYFADDRPQPQRLLEVISLGNQALEPHRIRVFLRPGENVSVHCYSPHNFRQKAPRAGAYIKQLHVRGPIHEEWPPGTYSRVFPGLPLEAEPRTIVHHSHDQTNLHKIGGTLTVSSFQAGMEKDKMQDGSNRTFWHTRFKPTVAEPPHFVILENPRGVPIDGLSYAAWTGGNGNGQIKGYEINVSEDGKTWGDPIAKGDLDTQRTFEQPIPFSTPTAKRFIRFLVTDARSLDGKSIASIGKLDVLVSPTTEAATSPDSRASRVSVRSQSPADLQRVLRTFARRAFASELSDEELAPYWEVSRDHFIEDGDFVEAARVGLKAILCSPRFLMAPGEHPGKAHARAAALSRALWLSVPDKPLLARADAGDLEGDSLRREITRMLADEKSERMIRSFSDQWLNLRAWNTVAPSLKLYPRYNELLDHFLPLETRTYLAHLIRENRPVSELIDSDYSFLNQRLARHYGVPGVIGHELRRVSFPPEIPRGGLLTMGSVLKITTDGFDTSPILRGAWISKNIVGTPLSPPPADVEVIEPDHGDGAATLREQIEQHKHNKTCAACHKSIDPYGFALENFDATGQWRTQYRVEKPHSGTFQYRPQGYYRTAGEVDAAGEIGDRQFSDVMGLKEVLLSDHRKIAYNFSRKFFEYATGVAPDLEQRLALFAMIPAEPRACRLRDLTTNVLVYALTGESTR